MNLFPLVSALILSISLLILQPFLPRQLPLFYSLPWGEAQLANIEQFLIIPASAACITLINLIIYWQLHESQILFKHILIGISLICCLILIMSFIKIMFVFL